MNRALNVSFGLVSLLTALSVIACADSTGSGDDSGPTDQSDTGGEVADSPEPEPDAADEPDVDVNDRTIEDDTGDEPADAALDVEEDITADATVDEPTDLVLDGEQVDGRLDASDVDDEGDMASDPDTADVADAPPARPPALFAIDESGGAPAAWLDATTLTADQAPDFLLSDLSGSEPIVMTRFGTALIIATDNEETPVLIWHDAQELVADAEPTGVIEQEVFGQAVRATDVFTSPNGDLWIPETFSIWRVANGAGGTPAGVVEFNSPEVSSAVIDVVGGTLFASSDLSQIVAWEGASTATGVDNEVTWSFATGLYTTLALGEDRLFAGRNSGAAGGALLEIWNGIGLRVGPDMPSPDVTGSTLDSFARYVSLRLAEGHLVGVLEHDGSTEVHVYESAAELSAESVPLIVSDEQLDGLERFIVASDGTLFGATGESVVVIENVLGTTPATPFCLQYNASDVVVIE